MKCDYCDNRTCQDCQWNELRQELEGDAESHRAALRMTLFIVGTFILIVIGGLLFL